MPIYAYRCTGCGHELDVLQKVSDAPLTECPSCHQPLLAKMVTAAGFQLKGSGWYVTDFRDKAAAKKDSKAEPAGNGESKGDAKPATETAAKSTESAAKSSESASSAPAPTPASPPPPAAS
jgi:putative FmdB family regulatory protein